MNHRGFNEVPCEGLLLISPFTNASSLPEGAEHICIQHDVFQCWRCKYFALQMPGVVAFVGPDDIPGENKVGLGGMDAQIFASEKTEYLHQTLGLIVAETPGLAEKAAKLVEVSYSHPKVCLYSTLGHHTKK